ncbi:MAG: hypothetical protein V4696_08215 [Pseudomonadota bacterium]
MGKAIHRSWSTLSEDGFQPVAATVALDFSGLFTEGSYEGTAFAGRIHYDSTTAPTERHVSFCMYEQWPSPLVTMAVGGQVLAAQGAAVYDSVFDGTANHYDFVTMYGTGPFDGVEEAAFFELYFADEDGATLVGTHLPDARQLMSMPVKQVSFGTNAPGNAMSVGSFTLTAAG